jgi:hypothetical protein
MTRIKQTKSTKQAPAKAARKEEVVRLRIICLCPPNPEQYGAAFGLQDNSTTAEWVLHSGQVQANGDVHFECECRVRRNPRTNDPNFLGPFVHGPTAQRFLYLSWRPKEWRPGQAEVPCSTWLRRMKVPLASIVWDQINEAIRRDGVLEITVPGAGRYGAPFGSVQGCDWIVNGA